jgi:hypothetical protein
MDSDGTRTWLFQKWAPSEVLSDTGRKTTPGDYPVEGNDSTSLFIYAEIIFKRILRKKG